MKSVGIAKKLLMLAALAVGSIGATQAKAATVVFATFSDSAGNQSSYVNSTGVLSATNAGATFTNLAGVIPYSGAVTYTLSATRIAGAAGNATLSGGSVSQVFSGSIAFKNAALQNVLTMNFTNAILAGTNNSQGSGITGDSSTFALTGQVISYSSDLQGTFISPFSFSLSLTTVPGLSVGANNNLTAFTATVGGSFSEDQSGTPNGAPLPAAVWGGLGMMGALGGIGALRRRRSM